jgi:hypothetical protein
MSFLILHAITRLATRAATAHASLGGQIGALLVEPASFRPLRAYRDRDRDCGDAEFAA